MLPNKMNLVDIELISIVYAFWLELPIWFSRRPAARPPSSGGITLRPSARTASTAQASPS